MQIIWIDECGCAKHMPRLSGYSMIGTRTYGINNWQERGRKNVIGALLNSRILTCSVFRCTINSDVFSAWVEEDLLEELNEKSIIVMDNASFHRRKDMKEKISSMGHILEYTPKYSPHLNKIEQKWSQVKAKIRETGRDIEYVLENYDL